MKLFVDRKNEMEELKALSQSKEPAMALLYGRRRVGKTYLLGRIWDREMDDSSLLLVLCGSEVSTMEALQAGDSPLFGRLSWSSRLRPFDYFDSSRMLPWLGLREAMYVYGALGGMPRYLSAVKRDEGFRESLCRILLSPRGEVHVQLQNLIAGEKGIRNTAEYDAVLRAVAAGRRELSEIASFAGLLNRTYVVRRILEVMENLDIIHRERNYGTGPKSPWRYKIGDNALLFWHRFIEPNRSRLERNMIDSVWETSIEPQMDTYMGLIFEDAARQTLFRFNAELGLPVISTCSCWEGLDRNRRSIELDIVGILETGDMLTGEVKWSSSAVNNDVHFQLLRNLEDLAASGQSWARQALQGWFVYFSAAGFSEYMMRLAEEKTRIVLVSLEDMFPGGTEP